MAYGIRQPLAGLALSSAALFLVGCGGGSSSSTPVPPKDSNANLASLSLSKGTLSTAFDPATTSYGVSLYSGAPSLTVTATAQSAKATLQVNGTTVASGSASAPVALPWGQTPIQIAVSAEDGTHKTYTVNVTEYQPLLPVWVLDSVNGNAVPSATISVLDASGKVLESGIGVNAKGLATLGFDPQARYTLLAQSAGSAQSTFVNLAPTLESSITLYCQPLGMRSFPAVAPQISQIAYSADGTTWTPVANNQITDTLAHVQGLKVTALGQSAVSPTSWSGYGVGINVDKPAWAWDFISAFKTDELAVPAAVNGLPWYRSTFEFGLPLTNLAAGTTHALDIVAYDVANNRTEQKVYLTITNGVATSTDPDLSNVVPSALNVRLDTFGLSRDIFVVSPVDGKNTSYSAYVQFNVGSGATAPGIRGFEIWRSTDGVNYLKIATNQYGSLSTGSSGIHFYYDNDPSLTENVTYYYKVKAFNGNTGSNGGYTPESPALSARFLAPHTVSLASPAMDSVVATLTPTLAFTISNPSLFDPAVSDFYRFYLFVKDKLGNTVYGQSYRYNFAAARFEKLSGSSFVDASSEVSVSSDKATLSIKLPATANLLPGLTYEWSVFGTKGGASASASDAASFIRFTPGSNSQAFGRSYGSTYEKSYGAINGFYTLIVSPNAQ